MTEESENNLSKRQERFDKLSSALKKNLSRRKINSKKEKAPKQEQ